MLTEFPNLRNSRKPLVTVSALLLAFEFRWPQDWAYQAWAFLSAVWLCYKAELPAGLPGKRCLFGAAYGPNNLSNRPCLAFMSASTFRYQLSIVRLQRVLMTARTAVWAVQYGNRPWRQRRSSMCEPMDIDGRPRPAGPRRLERARPKAKAVPMEIYVR